jgi:tubulin epsilon
LLKICDTAFALLLLLEQYGAGNNWAQGHLEYGGMYREELAAKFQRTVEMCDSLQSFFLLHSLGGGTGSGLGTFILSLLADEYPDVYR